MVNEMSPKATSVADVAKSGFPLQTAVARIVAGAKGWKVLSQETPWDDDGDPEFIDVVAWRDAVTLVIECKKQKEGILTFLETDSDAKPVTAVRHAAITFSKDSFRVRQFHIGRSFFAPASAESMFCVTSNSPQSRLLERDAGLVARAADQLARNIQLRQAGFREIGVPEGFLAVLVTTSILFRATYDSSEVSLETGELAGGAVHEELPWIRFTKAFSVPQDYRDVAERTVFVVSARHLQPFLEQVKIV
ncbi:MAG: hypothetical protein ABI672_20105 [Vicinamibacteria bacterium]